MTKGDKKMKERNVTKLEITLLKQIAELKQNNADLEDANHTKDGTKCDNGHNWINADVQYRQQTVELCSRCQIRKHIYDAVSAKDKEIKTLKAKNNYWENEAKFGCSMEKRIKLEKEISALKEELHDADFERKSCFKEYDELEQKLANRDKEWVGKIEKCYVTEIILSKDRVKYNGIVIGEGEWKNIKKEMGA